MWHIHKETQLDELDGKISVVKWWNECLKWWKMGQFGGPSSLPCLPFFMSSCKHGRVDNKDSLNFFKYTPPLSFHEWFNLDYFSYSHNSSLCSNISFHIQCWFLCGSVDVVLEMYG